MSPLVFDRNNTLIKHKYDETYFREKKDICFGLIIYNFQAYGVIRTVNADLVKKVIIF